MAYYQLPHVPPTSSYTYGPAEQERTAPPAATPSRTTVTASLLIGGALGLAARVLPVLFVVCLCCGLVAFTLGALSWRKGRRTGSGPAVAGAWPGAVAVALVGMVIALAAVHAIGDDIPCADDPSGSAGSTCRP